MSRPRTFSHTRPDIHRAQVALDELPHGAVVIDKYGHAWQSARGIWYRAFDGDGMSSWDIATLGPFKPLEVPSE